VRDIVCLIIGDQADEHVGAVLEHLEARSTLVLNPMTLASSTYTLSDSSLEIEIDGDRGRVGPAPARAWMRRLAPEHWHQGTTIGSIEGAAAAAWLTLLVGLMRRESIEWLSHPDAVVVAENKLHQLATARNLGLPTPPTVVSNDPAAIHQLLGDDYVVKPLGPAYFIEDGHTRMIFTQSASRDLSAALASGPPLLLQERLVARRHLRVVVVNDRVWGFALDASGVPLDWRRDDPSHDNFVATDTPAQVADGARGICRTLGLGYASQDWIETDNGTFLIDVNPSGQWLFLPSPGSDEISAAIADWMASCA
jgi:hypothetical protein